MANTIRQTTTFRSTPQAVYEALMDAKQHAAFTGGPAKISRKIGGKFSVFDGSITGKNLEVVPDKKIVQEWRIDEWPKGVKSVVTFALTKAEDGTRLTLTHTGVPDDHVASIARGWKDYYWGPMKEFLRNR